MTARDTALDALVRIDAGGFAQLVVPGILKDSPLDSRDRAFVTELVYGTVRQQRRLDAQLGRVAKRAPSTLEPTVRVGLRLGAWQLENGVAPHAAVRETVESIARRAPKARGYANACLRALTRLDEYDAEPPTTGNAITDLATALSYPDWIAETFVEQFGAPRAAAILELGNQRATVTLRAEPGRSTPAELAKELKATGASVDRGRLIHDALLVRGGGDPGAFAAVRDGRATPQDQGSQAIVSTLDPQPGERILDLAAAPGGKTTAIAGRVGPTGLVVAGDIHANRLHVVARAAIRLGRADIVRTAVADGTALPWRDAAFDRVLVDAPCSGLGVLRRRPDARWRVDPDALPELAERQHALLADAARVVRPGGRLVYSVCTLTEIETRGVDEWAAAHLADFVAEPPPGAPWEPLGRGARLAPDAADTDGMYVLILRAPGGKAESSPRPPAAEPEVAAPEVAAPEVATPDPDAAPEAVTPEVAAPIESTWINPDF